VRGEIHYAESVKSGALGLVPPREALCGALVLDVTLNLSTRDPARGAAGAYWTAVHKDVTCTDCLVRLLAFFHRASGEVATALASGVANHRAEITELRGVAAPRATDVKCYACDAPALKGHEHAAGPDYDVRQPACHRHSNVVKYRGPK
jgi:hypothetical protein